MKRKYTEPKLFPTNMDMKKPWFVAFRYTHPSTGERKQFQYRGDINSFDKKNSRIKEANSLIDALSSLLRDGWNPFDNEKVKEQDHKTLSELLDEMLDIKRSTLKPKSIRSYSDAKNMLQRWINSKGYSSFKPNQFTSKHARWYADYLLTERKYKGKTFNVNIGFVKNYFNMLNERELCKENPFAKITKMKEEVGKNHAFTANEKEILINHLKQHDIRIYYFVSFMYHGFIRRSEIMQLKISDINLNARTINIRSEVSKNRKQESVSIPEGLLKVIKEMNLDEYPESYYIFSHNFKPGEKILAKADYFTDVHKKHLVVLKFPLEKTLYSWKHTGVCDYFQVIKDPYVIMRQLRHSDLSITMIYLKSLGLTPNHQMNMAKLYL